MRTVVDLAGIYWLTWLYPICVDSVKQKGATGGQRRDTQAHEAELSDPSSVQFLSKPTRKSGGWSESKFGEEIQFV